ncbi:MAG: hypothetical protein ACXVQU_01270 [Actinomycetota bacterium]
MASKQQPRSGTATERVTKAERKEQARLERIELQRKMARARRNRTLWIVGLVVVGVAVVAVVALTSSGGKKGTSPQTTNGRLAGLMTGPQPWSANLDTLPQRLNELTLPTFGNPLALHWHAHLDLFVNGQKVTVPADVGFDSQAAASLHTHDQTGVVHMETNQTSGQFTLGEFFDVWGVRLTSTCIGGYCNNGNDVIRAYVDGRQVTGDPRAIQLKDQEEVVLTYGTAGQVPHPLPTFDWSTLQP